MLGECVCYDNGVIKYYIAVFKENFFVDKSKRNYILMFIDTILFVNAMVFLSTNVVIPYFLNDLGASTFQISLASALVSIGAFITQPFFAHLAMGLKIKSMFFSRVLFIQRLIFLVYILSMPLLKHLDPRLSILLFLISWGIFSLFVGSYSPFYMSILSKVIPGQQRGKLMGFSGAIANIIALGAAILVGVLLKSVIFPYNYAWVFGIGTILLIIDAGDFALMREQEEVTENKKISYLRYLKEMPHALKKQPGFAAAVAGNSFISVANVALVFYSLLAIRTYQAGPEQIAILTGIAVIINIISSGVFGIMADKYGHKYVLLSATIFGVAAAFVVFSVQSIIAVYIAFAFSNLCMSGYNISSSMHIIDNSPKNQIPLYVSINMMITLVMSSLMTLLSGVIVDQFSFVPVFILTGASAATGFIVLYLGSKKSTV